MVEISNRQALGFLVFLLKTIFPSSPLTGNRWDPVSLSLHPSSFGVLLPLSWAHSALLTATVLPTTYSQGPGDLPSGCILSLFPCLPMKVRTHVNSLKPLTFYHTSLTKSQLRMNSTTPYHHACDSHGAFARAHWLT